MKINDKSNPKTYVADTDRYNQMQYNRCGNSGVLLPKISLGLWHNFGFYDSFENARNVLKKAFDLGITHLDLANNYGPPYGSAEENFGRILKKDLSHYRDELFIASKAGYDMWPGPYGNNGSKKYLMSSLDQSLQRMGLDYVDVFYHHRPDTETPLEETMMALDLMVKQGKALYVGVSNYNAAQTQEAYDILKRLGTPCLIHQAKYSMLERTPENELFPTLLKNKMGGIVFSPLAQGQLTDKYLNNIPENSRAFRDKTNLDKDTVLENLDKIQQLNEIAKQRGQKLSQMAISWILTQPAVTSVLIGASSPDQLSENIKALDNTDFSDNEIHIIDTILNQ